MKAEGRRQKEMKVAKVSETNHKSTKRTQDVSVCRGINQSTNRPIDQPASLLVFAAVRLSGGYK